jgi:hypothetical protein
MKMVTLRPSLLAITSSLTMSGVFALSCLGLSGLSACGSEGLEGAKAEVAETSIKLDLPAVPAFDIPTANPDGSHPVTEMRLNGKAFLDSEVRISGTVLWIYDCGTSIQTPEMTEKELKTILETQPERCTRPHFIIGEPGETKIERGIEVVEYPRALREDEEGMFGEEMEAQMALDLAALPPFAVGDSVLVTGKWALSSPKGFHNSEGLLTYGSMVNNSAPAAPTE